MNSLLTGRTTSRAPACRIIAGPNGAGKTTFALRYLPEVAPGTSFVNADLIAAGLSPLAPELQAMAASRPSAASAPCAVISVPSADARRLLRILTGMSRATAGRIVLG